ncbi:MAG: DCC1-like thiol-disulfide oxidoreductase family protein [Bacteroidales bacterium]|jgi:predicted DCC family thiol-disulfide oxidoreductase YuxK|nr:DCC1-like thiol-disulfide oxidoreductase family protein [Bacteroidales bacterium]
MQNQEHAIILFDGVCHLCNGSVNFLLKMDKKERFKFSPLQSPNGQAVLKQHQLSDTGLDTFIFIHHGKCYSKSTAALKVLKSFGRGWQIFYIFIIIPRFIRDFIYDLVARHRYRLFGRSEQCMVPNPDIERRFL